MKRTRTGFPAVLAMAGLLLVLGPVRSGLAQEPIAVVVQPGNPLTTISLDELRRFYLGTSTAMPNKEPVVLVESAEARARFYATVLRMNPDRVKRHWIGAVFSGESGTPPREVSPPADLLQFVAGHPGAIAFVRAAAVDRSVKILTVDGHRPGDPNYPIR